MIFSSISSPWQLVQAFSFLSARVNLPLVVALHELLDAFLSARARFLFLPWWQLSQKTAPPLSSRSLGDEVLPHLAGDLHVAGHRLEVALDVAARGSPRSRAHFDEERHQLLLLVERDLLEVRSAFLRSTPIFFTSSRNLLAADRA